MAKQLEYLPTFYQAYVDLVPEEQVIQAIINNADKINSFIEQIPEQSGNFRYAEYKWTVKQVIAHMIDTERIFAYRALRFSRNDKTPLPGFDEKEYVPESNASNRTIKQLGDEFANARTSTIDLFISFAPEMFDRYGDANGHTIGVDSIGFVIAGHALHHHNILKERYNVG